MWALRSAPYSSHPLASDMKRRFSSRIVFICSNSACLLVSFSRGGELWIFVVDRDEDSAYLVGSRLRGRVPCNAFAGTVIAAGLRGG